MLRKTVFFFSCLTIFTSMDGSIIKKPPSKPVEMSFKELTCTEQDQSIIYEIIDTMAANGKLSLLLKQSHLKEIGAQINHVHPLKFLLTIFSDPHLKSCMQYIWGDYFKRNGFLDGLAPNLTREAEKGKLEQHIKDFAGELNISAEGMKPYFDAHDWEGLVLHLINS